MKFKEKEGKFSMGVVSKGNCEVCGKEAECYEQYIHDDEEEETLGGVKAAEKAEMEFRAKLTKEEFIGYHPGLKGEIFGTMKAMFSTKKNPYGEVNVCRLKDIHKTQLDKQRVKKVICNRANPKVEPWKSLLEELELCNCGKNEVCDKCS